ncbi:MAG TPA: amidohydrolase [Clostridia bacterium]|jgi:5-methylthioadenosine/S-adenosylhomocysteine deaminase|nr:amidohydrolase [Clostridia bacterium]HHY05375.1 amidohydrolase [Clostridia bacterium]
MEGLLIKNALIVPMDDCVRTQDWFKGDVVIEGSLIKEVGENLQAKYPYFTVIKGEDSLVMPGFVNCHTHAAMTMLRGYADDLPLMTWLKEMIWPREAHLNGEDIYWGTQLAILEMIKSGTTTFADMYFYMNETAQAVMEAGIRASLSRGMVGSGEAAGLALEESVEFIKTWQGQGEGRITCMLGPHAPYTCPPAYLEQVISLADDLGVGIHIHLAETEDEVAQITQQYGWRPVELMDSLGLFQGRHVLAAHCVHLSAKEMEILAKNKVGIAHNPESNMKLASGIAPLSELLAKGALVGLGTDGASSNNNLDMLEEMRTCALLHKVATMDPTVLPVGQVLKMATKDGAKALGLDNVGSLAPGQKADLLIFDLKKPHWTPLYNPIANLVYAAQSSDLKTVIIDGKIVMQDRQVLTMDEARILYEAEKRGQDLIRRKVKNS